MPKEANDLLRSSKPVSLYFNLFKDILSSFKLRCATFYGLEFISLVSQLLIALVFLILFRKLGLDDNLDAVNPTTGYRAVLRSWAQVLSMPMILLGLLGCLSVNAIASFASTRLINRVGRNYEDLNVHRAFQIFSNLNLTDFIAINRLIPISDRTAVQLMQSDVRMTAISARQLVRGSFSIVIIIFLLGIMSLIDISFFLGTSIFLILSIVPIVYFFRAGMIHSFELLSYAPLMTKSKQALFKRAISREGGLSANDTAYLEAYDNKDGQIKQYMDEFEYRFQLINNGALTFDGLAKALTILTVFVAIYMVGSGRMVYTQFILVILLLNLVVAAYKGITATTSSISRYFVHVVKFRLFLKTCARTIDTESLPQSATPYFSSSMPSYYSIRLDVIQEDVDYRDIDQGDVVALLMTGPANKLKAFSLYSSLFQTPELHSWMLDNVSYINDNDDLNTDTLFSFLNLPTNAISGQFSSFYEKLNRIMANTKDIPQSPRSDWTRFLSIDAHQIIVRTLGGYVFSGRIVFLNAELIDGVSEELRNRLFAEMSDGITFLYDRRAKPNISNLKSLFKKIVLFDGDVSTIMSVERLYSLTHSDVMSYIKKGNLLPGNKKSSLDESSLEDSDEAGFI